MNTFAKQKLKGCLISSHKDDIIIYICVSPECLNQSRLLCLECCMQMNKCHPGCENYLLKVAEIASGTDDPLKISKWPTNQTIKNIFKNMSGGKSDEIVIQEIDNIFDRIQENILVSLNQLKMVVKDQVNKNQNQYNEIQPYLQEETNRLLNISPISHAYVQLNKNQISLAQFQYVIKEFSENLNLEQWEQTFLCKYEQQTQKYDIKNINYESLTVLGDSVYKYLCKKEKKLFMNKILTNIQFQPMKDCEKNCSIKDGKNYISRYDCYNNGYCNFESTQGFERDQEVRFQFKLTHKPNDNCLMIGIVSVSNTKNRFWMEEGIQINIILEKNQYKQDSFKLKKKSFLQVWYPEKIFQMSVNVKQNKVKFSDMEGEFILENETSLKDIRNWKIVFGGSGRDYYHLQMI